MFLIILYLSSGFLLHHIQSFGLHLLLNPSVAPAAASYTAWL